MNVIFKKSISENNRLTKRFSQTSNTYNCQIKDYRSVMDMVILIGTTENLTIYNYCEISALNRKYFINDIKVIRSNLYEISLHVDVLSTYENEIRNLSVVAKRSSNIFNKYLNDSEYKILAKENVITKTFPNGFNKNLSLVLTTAG